jgi:hypothetical protein
VCVSFNNNNVSSISSKCVSLVISIAIEMKMEYFTLCGMATPAIYFKFFANFLRNLFSVQVGGARMKPHDSQSGGSEYVVENRGSSEHFSASQSLLQSFPASSQQNSYLNMNAQQGSYLNVNSQQSYQGSYQQSPYQLIAQHGSYPNISVPQGTYHNISAQQGYQY